MSEVVRISEVEDYVDEEVVIRGWLFNSRSSGGIWFLQIRDGSGRIQAVVTEDEVDEEVFEVAGRLTMESSLIVTGKVVEDKRSPVGFEIHISDLEAIQIPDEDYPIQKKEHGVDFLMSNRHLWLRSSRQEAILRVRARVIRAAVDFLDENDFLRVDAPILTGTVCEGTTTLFETEYFGGETAYLSQSGQLYNEATAMAFGKVYCFGPTLRAEKSKTRRHINEFWQIEPEMIYYDLDDNIELQEEHISYIIKEVLENNVNELEYLERDIQFLKNIEPPFPRLRYSEAVDLVKNSDELTMEYGEHLGADEERVISENYDKPFFITHFPVDQKPFYMKHDPDNPELTLSMDMLAPEGYGEIVGGGVREEDISTLKKEMMREGIPQESLEWYLDLRRYGSVPHSGYGLGIDRVVMWICGIHHIREAIPFPRTLTRLYP